MIVVAVLKKSWKWKSEAGRALFVSLVQAQVLLRRRGQRSTLAQVAALSLWRERAQAQAQGAVEAGVIRLRLYLVLSIVA